jgi:PAS domain-containing protein
MVPPALIKGGATMSTLASRLWIDTDDNGMILNWNPDVLPLTGYAPKSMHGRLLQIMLLGNRPGLIQFRRVMLGNVVEREGLIRPREQRAIAVRYRIEIAPESSKARPLMRWTFERL